MAINVSLESRREVDPAVQPIARTFVGFDAKASDEELWNANRGAWVLPEDAAQQQFATFSHDGTIRLVAELEGVENVDDQGRRVQALLGRILHPGDPVRDALVGRSAPAKPGVSFFDTTELDQMSPAERYAPTERERRTFLLLFNPEQWFWSPDDEAEVISRTGAGISVRESWSAGGRRHGIEPGDRVFILQTGSGPRGVRGAGVVSSHVYTGEHWDDPSRSANYIDVDWHLVLPTERLIATEDLLREVPGYAWNPQKPGVELHQPMAAQMDALWDRVTSEDGMATVQRDTGWELDDPRRRAVRGEALRRLTEHYEADGWEVHHTLQDRPYNAVATRGDEVRYLFARAIETVGRPVIMDGPSREQVLADPEHCVLGVLSDAVLNGTTVEPGTGKLRLLPFSSDAEDYTPVVWRYLPQE